MKQQQQNNPRSGCCWKQQNSFTQRNSFDNKNEDERRLTKHMDNFPMKRTLLPKGKSCTGESLKEHPPSRLIFKNELDT